MTSDANRTFFTRIRPEVLRIAASGGLDEGNDVPVPPLFYEWFLYRNGEPPADHEKRITATADALCDLCSHRADPAAGLHTLREFSLIAHHAGISRHAPLDDDQTELFEYNVILVFKALAHLCGCERCFRSLLAMSSMS